MLEQLEQNPTSQAIGWLLEMEAVTNPAVLNATILNCFRMVPGLKNTEFVIDTKSKKLLIYLELKWLHAKLWKRKTEDKVLELLDQALPGFKKRVIFDRALLEKALVVAQRQAQ